MNVVAKKFSERFFKDGTPKTPIGADSTEERSFDFWTYVLAFVVWVFSVGNVFLTVFVKRVFEVNYLMSCHDHR